MYVNGYEIVKILPAVYFSIIYYSQVNPFCDGDVWKLRKKFTNVNF